MSTRAQSLTHRIPVAVVVAGKSYTATRSSLNTERALQLYGTQEAVTQSLTFAVADIAGKWTPESTNLLTVDGKELRVHGHEYDAARAMVRIDLGAKFS